MQKKLPIFYSALMLTAVNLLLRFAGTSFQVYLSGRIGAAGIGLLQLVMSVGGLAMTAGIRRVFEENPSAFDPRQYLTVGRDEVKKMVAHKIVNVLGSDNKL